MAYTIFTHVPIRMNMLLQCSENSNRLLKHFSFQDNYHSSISLHYAIKMFLLEKIFCSEYCPDGFYQLIYIRVVLKCSQLDKDFDNNNTPLVQFSFGKKTFLQKLPLTPHM